MGEERVQPAYVYHSKNRLTSIHESSDSSKSDRSEEDGGSDSGDAEKRKAEGKTEAKVESEEVKVGLRVPEAKDPTEVLSTPLSKDFNQTMCVESMQDRSGCNFDYDNVSEGYLITRDRSCSIEINMPQNLRPKPFPTSYHNTPTGSVLHTESTTADDALSSGGHSRKNSNMIPRELYHSPNCTIGYSANPQFLMTQPVRHLAAPAMHTHTKSYDFTPSSISPPPAAMYGYMCPSPYETAAAAAPGLPAPPMAYYTQYVEPTGEYQWEEQMGYPYYVSSTMSYPTDAGAAMSSSGKKGGRRKNPESEVSRAMYAINLEDVISKKDQRTTIMIKNIPNKYNQKMLLKKIDEGSKRQYDFFYLPIDFKVRLAKITQNRTGATWATHSSTSSRPYTSSSSMSSLTPTSGRSSTQRRCAS